MYGDYYYDYGTQAASSASSGVAAIIWVIISLIVAIIGGIVLYCLFVKPDKEIKNNFLAWVKDFLNYKKMLIEDLLKTIYLINAIFITLGSFALIGTSFIGFILLLILGNVGLRLVFEGLLIKIMIWKNTTELNSKIKKQ